MFGLKIVTKKKLAEINKKAYFEALGGIIEMLKNKDKIFTKTVTILDAGDGLEITNCAFMGSPVGLDVKKEK